MHGCELWRASDTARPRRWQLLHTCKATPDDNGVDCRLCGSKSRLKISTRCSFRPVNTCYRSSSQRRCPGERRSGVHFIANISIPDVAHCVLDKPRRALCSVVSRQKHEVLCSPTTNNKSSNSVKLFLEKIAISAKYPRTVAIKQPIDQCIFVACCHPSLYCHSSDRRYALHKACIRQTRPA